jgi:hypothetical protein
MAEILNEEGIKSEVATMEQNDRNEMNQVIGRFESGKVQMLCATTGVFKHIMWQSKQ